VKASTSLLVHEVLSHVLYLVALFSSHMLMMRLVYTAILSNSDSCGIWSDMPCL
jgi:hypothetical protein